MSDPEEYMAGSGTADSVTGQVDSEYHYTRDSIYSDAHFEPAGAATEPPRYYKPPERQVRESKPRKKKKRTWLKTTALCLVCTLLGGGLGAGISERRPDEKLQALEARLSDSLAQQFAQVDSRVSSVNAASDHGMSGAQIFEIGKNQVVGIKTEVTYTNFFGMTSSSAVNGSGFVYSDDGYILTNFHVIETAYLNNLDITVMTFDGTEYIASIVGFDTGNDIALLKIEATGLNPAKLGNSDSIVMGETVYAIGNPLGELAYSMSTGTVSGLNRLIVTDAVAEGINMFQIDAAVNHGNSGGPVYNSLGEVIGIVTAKSGDTDAEGIGFAVPINDAVSIADDLITKGYVTGRAYLGVRLDERYNSMYAQFYNMPLGAYIYSVDSGSAAEAAGLTSGDIITAVDSYSVSSYSDLQSAVRRYSAGDSAVLSFYRSGEYLTATIVFDEARPLPDANANQVLDAYSSTQN